MIHISHLTQSIAVPYSGQIAALFPHGQRFEFEGQELMLVPHGADETQLLRNLGYAMPAPIEEHYDFPSADGKRPFSKQVATSASMTMNRRSFVLNGMGICVVSTSKGVMSDRKAREEKVGGELLCTVS